MTVMAKPVEEKLQGPERYRLGDILVKRRVITPEQLAQALKIQKREQKYLGEILIQLGYLEERDIVVALVVQYNLPYIAIDRYTVDSHIVRLIPEPFLREHCIFPLDRVGEVLSVVMANPLDQAVRAELKRMTGCRIAPFIATKTEIQRAQAQWFDKGSR